MYVKQIDLKKALELVTKGIEVKVLVPGGTENSWRCMFPDTLQNVLNGMLLFQTEPAMEKPEFEELGESQSSFEPKTKRTLKVDTGKMLALRKAGWSVKKIAEELKVSEGSVYSYLRKLEIEE